MPASKLELIRFIGFCMLGSTKYSSKFLDFDDLD